jgi:hypothetical protein
MELTATFSRYRSILRLPPAAMHRTSGSDSVTDSRKSPGKALFANVVAEMADVGLAADAKETALLKAAAVIVDRMAALEERVAADGEVIVSASGGVKIHPAAVEHRQLAVTLPKC